MDFGILFNLLKFVLEVACLFYCKSCKNQSTQNISKILSVGDTLGLSFFSEFTALLKQFQVNNKFEKILFCGKLLK